MVSLQEVISQLSGGRLTALDSYIMKRQCFVLIGIGAYSDMDLPSLHAKLLPKLKSVDLQNALFTIT